jgi:hypothetical protein
MPSANYLPEVLETTEAERLATGFTFTEVQRGIPMVIGILSICVRTNFFG